MQTKEGWDAGAMKLAIPLALLAVLAVVAWTLLPEDQGDFDAGQPLAEEREGRFVALADELDSVTPGGDAQAERTDLRAPTGQSMPVRRGALDAFAMPFPFSGRCVANGRPVARATVHYKGDTRITDEDGHFSFPSYGYALRVIVEAEGFGQLIASSSESRMILQMQPPAIGRVIVRDSLRPVEAAQVTVFLLPEGVKSSKERYLFRDLPVIAKQETDSKGFAFFPALPTYDRHENAMELLYCLIEYPDGGQHEDFLIPRKQAVSRGAPRIEWSRDYSRDGAASSQLRVERRDEFGNRVPVPDQLVYYRVNPVYLTP
jgi:hypothetical protein